MKTKDEIKKGFGFLIIEKKEKRVEARVFDGERQGE
jgi:hypothetical protein